MAVTDPTGGFGTSCVDYDGYHSQIKVGSVTVGYAVVLDCPNFNDQSVAAVHEYYEWATDPFPVTAPAYSTVDDEHWAWNITMLGELGDLCSLLDYANYQPPGIDYVGQRFYSNKLAKAGKFPCAPNKTTAYAQAIPIATDTLRVPSVVDSSKTVETKGVYVKRGTSRDIDVFIYSDVPNTEVSLHTYSREEFSSQTNTSGFTYAFATGTAHAGDTVKLTITASKSSSFDVLSTATRTADDYVYWPIVVTSDTARLDLGSNDAGAALYPGWATPHHRLHRPANRAGATRSSFARPAGPHERLLR